MEYLVFEDLYWDEIPPQDNPVTDYKDKDNLIRNEECLVVCKHTLGYIVIYVPVKGYIETKGIFPVLEDAIKFAIYY